MYHEANGITVENEKVNAYAEVAKIIIFNFFDVKVEDISPKGPGRTKSELFGEYILNWAKLEQRIINLTKKQGLFVREHTTPLVSIHQLEKTGTLPPEIFTQFRSERLFRNELVHAVINPTFGELNKHNEILMRLLEVLTNS